MATRNVDLFGVVPVVTELDKAITGAKIPAIGDILRCFLFHSQHSDD